MQNAETKEEICRRHLREGHVRIERQREIIARLTVLGGATEQAERLLLNFLDVQRLGADHLARLLSRALPGALGP
jgi:hypothetical protein